MSEMPVWDSFLIHVLRYLADGVERGRSEINLGASHAAGLSEAQRTESLQSGQPKAFNRIGWATSFLTRVGAIDRPSRGRYRISESGAELLTRDPSTINEAALKHLYTPSTRKPHDSSGQALLVEKANTDLDPIEQIEQGLVRIQTAVADELLARLQSNPPVFFESAVVKLLVAMGYGGSDGTATVTQLTNDAGIDGVIDRDALGLDRVYIQAKRYEADRSVQRPDVQGFVGALSGKANTGVFITTGKFSQGAINYATTAHTRIILIDGNRLSELMLRYGVGVQVKQSLQIIEIDEDFFE